MSSDQRKSGLISIFAIVVIAVLELYALSKGINGKCLTMSIAAIAGVGGFTLRGVLPKG